MLVEFILSKLHGKKRRGFSLEEPLPVYIETSIMKAKQADVHCCLPGFPTRHMGRIEWPGDFIRLRCLQLHQRPVLCCGWRLLNRLIVVNILQREFLSAGFYGIQKEVYFDQISKAKL